MRKKRLTTFDCVNGAVMILFSLSVLFPFWHLLVISFDSPAAATTSGIHLWPAEFSLSNYGNVFGNKVIWNAYGNTIYLTVLGTVTQLLFTAMAGYAISKRYFPQRGFWTFFVVFTMFFGGGLIPSYLLMRTLRLFDSYAALILPGLVGSYNMVLMRNFFMAMPEEIEESCMVDGAGRFTIFFRIVLPMSAPILATIALWLAVGFWNSWFNVLLYIRDLNRFTLQIILRRIIMTGTDEKVMKLVGDEEVSAEGVKAASIYVATVPILCVYPFVQKYFVKGVLVGSLKG